MSLCLYSFRLRLYLLVLCVILFVTSCSPYPFLHLSLSFIVCDLSLSFSVGELNATFEASGLSIYQDGQTDLMTVRLRVFFNSCAIYYDNNNRKHNRVQFDWFHPSLNSTEVIVIVSSSDLLVSFAFVWSCEVDGVVFLLGI